MIADVEILGLIAGFVGTMSSVPQIFKVYKSKDAKAISVATYMMAFCSTVLWFIYGIIQSSVSILFWNVIGILLISCVLIMKVVILKERE